MKGKIVAVLAAAAALSFTAVGSAAATPLGPANEHVSAAPPQVNGLRLQAAMLPASAFGPTITRSDEQDTGTKLQSTHAKYHVPSMGCAKFEISAFDQGFGNTAGAWVRLGNPDENSQYPNTTNAAFESVFQFATAKAATTFQSQARSKFAACGSFTDSSGNFWRTLSVAKTTVGGHQAFLVTQQLMGPSFPFGRLVVGIQSIRRSWHEHLQYLRGKRDQRRAFHRAHEQTDPPGPGALPLATSPAASRTRHRTYRLVNSLAARSAPYVLSVTLGGDWRVEGAPAHRSPAHRTIPIGRAAG